MSRAHSALTGPRPSQSPTSSQNSSQNALLERNSISSIPAWPARGPPASPARPGAGCQPCPLGNHSLRSRPQGACGSLYFRPMPRKEPGAGGGTGTAGGSNQLSFVNVFYLLGGSHTFLREFNESLNLLSARGVESRRTLPSERIWDVYCHQP